MPEMALRRKRTKGWFEAVQSAGNNVFSDCTLRIRRMSIVRYPAFNLARKAGDRGSAEMVKVGGAMTEPGRASWRCRWEGSQIFPSSAREERCDSNRVDHVGGNHYTAG